MSATSYAAIYTSGAFVVFMVLSCSRRGRDRAIGYGALWPLMLVVLVLFGLRWIAGERTDDEAPL